MVYKYFISNYFANLFLIKMPNILMFLELIFLLEIILDTIQYNYQEKWKIYSEVGEVRKRHPVGMTHKPCFPLKWLLEAISNNSLSLLLPAIVELLSKICGLKSVGKQQRRPISSVYKINSCRCSTRERFA